MHLTVLKFLHFHILSSCLPHPSIAAFPDSDDNMSTLRAGHDTCMATPLVEQDPRTATPRAASTQQVC